MVTTATPYMLPQKTQDGLIDYCRSTQTASFQLMDLRSKFQYIDKEYIRENVMQVESAQSRAANQGGDKRKIQDIVIPLVEPQCETALAYLTGVFLSGNPIFGVVSDAANINQAKQMEAILSENSIRGGWARQFLMFFLDGLKYNFQAMEVDWCTEKIYTLETDAAFSTSQGKPKEVVWSGNKLKRMDPYNTIFDPRAKVAEQHIKAEFVGYVELFNRVALSQFLQALPYRMNVTKAFESMPQGLPSTANQSLYYIPEVFTENFSLAKMSGMMNWDSWATGGKSVDVRIRFKNLYCLCVRYCRIIPADFDMQVPARNQVQIWKIITVNDAVVVYIERMTNVHNYLPIIFGQPMEDGLNFQTKSFAQKQIPLQDLASALANSKLAARRRLVADRGLYDPSRIREADINSENPSAKIPVRPSAYGQDLAKAYYQIPFKDEQTGTIMQDVREVSSYSDYLSGQNKAQQGQFVKGNKTQHEYEDVQSKSSGRQVTMAIRIENQTMVPIKTIIKFNILQYQPAGAVYSYVDDTNYNINPIELRKTALNFKVSDGLLPSEKLMEGETFGMALQMVATSPALEQEYSVGGMFTYMMKSRGVDLTQFKYTPEQLKTRQDNEMKMMDAKASADAKAKGLPAPPAAAVGTPNAIT